MENVSAPPCPLRLVIATPLYPPEIGGPATYARALKEALPARDPSFRIAVVAFASVRALPKVVRHLAYGWQVFRAARGADLVLALDPVSVGVPARLAAYAARKPFVVKIVGDYAWEQGRQRFGIADTLDAFVARRRVPLPVRLLRAAQTFVARTADRVLVPSAYLKRIVEAWGIPGDAIEVIPNAIELPPPGAVPDAVAALPRPVVVTVGRLVPWKHVDAVIDAVAAHPTATLAIVGDGPERPRLAARAARQLPGRAVLTGALAHGDALATMAHADLFVLNSSYEGLSHLLIEALTLGCPIVATDAGGNPEVVGHERTGLLVPAGDTPVLTQAVERLLGDTDLAARYAAAAHADAARFGLDAMLEATGALLRRTARR